MGYLDTRQKIIDTLTGRAVGTQIQPINHQEFALALLDYIRQVELITASTLVGRAERGTVPVQSDKANLAYVASCPVGETVVFENFHGQDGQPLQYTADVNSAAIIILIWNKEYWTMTAVPASVPVTADNVNYTTSIRKTYASKSAMEADTNPVDEKNIPITNGQLVSVVNNSDATHNGIYAREGAGWTFQSGFNFGLVQTTGQDVNHAMSQKATTDALAAQAADVDKIEEDVRGTLTLSQLDNPLGFSTNLQWAQGLNEDKTYTFRLVDTSGRCIGHVWLLNDADYDSSRAARFLEMVMCCASIDAETGALTTDARWGSPRLYYRTFCTPLSGGTPDGGLPASIFKWSAWQEYRDYVAKPIKDALAALQQQHDTDVANLQASIDATLAAIPTGVLNLGMSADADTILSEAAKYAVASDPFKAVITGQYMVGTAVQSIVIHQQVTKNSNGSGVCMQYVYKDKARYTRYINFNASARVTAVQGLQPDGVRNLYYTDKGFIGQRDAWGTQVGSGFFLPNKNDLREGTPTATSVPLVLTKSIKDTVTCNLGPATTARAGVMTVVQVEQLADAKAKVASMDKALKGVEVSAYSYAFRYVGNLVDEDSVKAKEKLVRLLNSYCTTSGDLSLSEILAIYKSPASELLPFTGTLRGQINGVPFIVRQSTSSWGNFYTQTLIGPFVFSGGYFNTASGVEHTWVRSIDTSGTEVIFGDWYEPELAQAQKLANLEARIAALEAK